VSYVFFYHTRLNKKTGRKLDASIIFLQYEIGLFDQFLSTPFSQYSHLVTTTLIKTIWGEMEPNNFHLKSAQKVAWTPQAQGVGDSTLMTIATLHYGKKESTLINRYQLYLQVFSLYDIITYDGKIVHLHIMNGERVMSRTSTTYWVKFCKPPKKYLTTWQSFITNHIIPVLNNTKIQWFKNVQPHYSNTFYHFTVDNNLYQSIPEGFLVYEQKCTKHMTITDQYNKHTVL
jgi:hypothetical protein